ncbi:kirola-like isoform X2 [Punica granatum]|uniref:Kirola-like isoform X2 n=1 Tax=Punica granatum TaxID=22663 RepID=A0A6P8E900_PUNGR|nr:kirola-like isoform X2 [Punica granatum]
MKNSKEFMVEIKSRADVFYGFLKDKVPQYPQLYPEAIKGFKFLEGSDEVRDGAVVCYEYGLGGSTMTIKEKLEVNESSKSINFVMMEGDVLKLYNSIKYKFQVNSGYVKVDIEFEKASEDTPNPDGYIDMISELIKRLETCLCST